MLFYYIIIIFILLLLLLLYSILFIFIFYFYLSSLLSPLSFFLLHLPSPTHFFSLLTTGHHSHITLFIFYFYFILFSFPFFPPILLFLPQENFLWPPPPPIHFPFSPISPPISQGRQPPIPKNGCHFFLFFIFAPIFILIFSGAPFFFFPQSATRAGRLLHLFFFCSPPHSPNFPFYFSYFLHSRTPILDGQEPTLLPSFFFSFPPTHFPSNLFPTIFFSFFLLLHHSRLPKAPESFLLPFHLIFFQSFSIFSTLLLLLLLLLLFSQTHQSPIAAGKPRPVAADEPLQSVARSSSLSLPHSLTSPITSVFIIIIIIIILLLLLPLILLLLLLFSLILIVIVVCEIWVVTLIWNLRLMCC